MSVTEEDIEDFRRALLRRNSRRVRFGWSTHLHTICEILKERNQITKYKIIFRRDMVDGSSCDATFCYV